MGKYDFVYVLFIWIGFVYYNVCGLIVVIVGFIDIDI